MPPPLASPPRSRRHAGRAGAPPDGVEAPSTRWPVPPMALLVAGCLALAALTLLLPAAPTYDPWSWINWGREVTRLDLNTLSGPSWKPLPVLFTIPFSLAGEAAPDLWLVVARAGGLLSLVMSYRLAARLAGPVAGTFAAAALPICDGYFYTVALGNSEGLLVALALWAVERHLDGRTHHAFWLGVLVALLRPEAWPFLGLYAAWLWLAEPERRLVVAGGIAAVGALWFLPELWGSGELLRSSDRAATPDSLSPAFADQPALAVLGRALATLPAPALVGLAIGLVLAGVRLLRGRGRDATVAILAGGALAWLALVAAMTEAGYSGNFRYLILPVALLCVLAGVAWARLAEALPARAGARIAVAVLLLAAAVPFAPRLAERAPHELAKLSYEAALYDGLDTAVARAGGARRVLACGRPVAGPYQVPGLAWRLGVHGIDVGLEPGEAGTVFRAPPVIGAPPEPRLHSADPRLRPVARAGPWEVFSACR